MTPRAPHRPPHTTAAIWLLWVHLGTTIALLILSLSYLAPHVNVSIGTLIFVNAVVLGLSGFVYYKIGQGRNWARITVALITVYGVFSFVFGATPDIAPPVYLKLLGWGNLSISVVAVVLLYTAQSSRWFEKPTLSHESGV